jgi:hypothetical protein
MMNAKIILIFLVGTYSSFCLSFQQALQRYEFPNSFRILRMSLDGRNQESKVTSIRSSTLQSLSANLLAITASLSALPTIAVARQGAFEMDVEYYLKTVASRAQGKPDAVINAKTAKPAFASARVLNKELANNVVTVVREEISRITGISAPEVETKVNAQKLLYLPYFKEFVPIRVEDVSDQYYFDITLYVSYLVAAQLIPKSTDRVVLRKAVGDRVLELLMQKGLIGSSKMSKDSALGSTPAPDNLQPSRGNSHQICGTA